MYTNCDNQIEGLEHRGIFIRALTFVNHLGNLTGPKLRDHAVSYATGNFCIAYNIILNTFSKLSRTVRYKLFKKYYKVWCLIMEFVWSLC